MAFLFSLILATATPMSTPWPSPDRTATRATRSTAGAATAYAADTQGAHDLHTQQAVARGTALGWPSVTATPTTEPTPTAAPTASDTPRPYTPAGPTPTLAPRPTRTAFTVTARPTATHPTRTATATGTPTAGARRFVVALPLLLRRRIGSRTW